jgi:leader peptidase (prepilin peptidase)/N-methyltransferase
VAITAALIAALAFRPDHYSFLPALLTAAFGLALAVLASTDFERRRIPNRLIYPAIVLAVAFAWAWPDRDVFDIALGLLAAAALAAVVPGLGVLVGRDLVGFGAGDLKLILLAGLLLGWPLLIPALVIGVLLAGIPAVVMIVSGRGRERYAYGPYLCAGTIAVMLIPDTFAF